MRKPVILLVMDYFLPAYKAGGPIRSIANLTTRLRDEFDFRILTRNRDIGDTHPLPGIEADRWLLRDGHQVRYLPPTHVLPARIWRASRGVPFDLVYLNSLFSPFTVSVLTLRRIGLLRRVPVVLTPRGELAPSALKLKRGKKRIYLAAARGLGLYRDLLWHAASEAEREAIARFGGGPIWVAANVPDDLGPPPPALAERPPKRRGAARFVFLGRLARNKNIEYALRLLPRVQGELLFDIYGTSEDPGYLEELRGWMSRLPPHVGCAYRGPVAPHAVRETLADYHFFLFPSFSESFGHGILEAMLAGLPVLISDGTYWIGLASEGAGYDVPLRDETQFLDRLQGFVDLDGAGYTSLSASAARFAADHVRTSTAADDYRRLFRGALEGPAADADP